MMNRRKFLRAAGTAGAVVTALPTVVDSFSVRALAGGDPRLNQLLESQDRILILIQMNGGNDGLNTVIPYTDPLYYERRPTIGIAKNKALRINDSLGWHPSLKGFRDLYDAGQLAVVQGVTYPNPDRSHFRGTDIWLTATDADVFSSTGWVGRYLQTLAPSYPTELPAHPLAVQIGTSTSLGLLGTAGPMGISFRDPDEFYRLVNGGAAGGEVPSSAQADTPAGREVTFMRNIARSADIYADVIKQSNDKSTAPTVSYPATDIASKLKVVGQLINGGLTSRIYLISFTGNNFDTHANQTLTTDPTLGTHANLLAELGDAVAAFMTDMKNRGQADRISGMTFSEFGRRVAENGSVGTDHGTAAPLFVFGSQVNGAVYGRNPDLTDLDMIGDLKMQHDYRDVYASVLLQWFGVAQTRTQELLFQDFSKTAPALFKGAPSAVDNDQTANPVFIHVGPNPATDVLVVRVDLPATVDATLELRDMRGKQVAAVRVESWTGVSRIPVTSLPAGSYVLTLQHGQTLSHTFVQINR